MRQRFFTKFTTDAPLFYRDMFNTFKAPLKNGAPTTEDRKPSPEEQEEQQREEAEAILMQQEEAHSKDSEELENLGYVVITPNATSPASNDEYAIVRAVIGIDGKNSFSSDEIS